MKTSQQEHSLFVEAEESQYPLTIKSRFPHFSQMGYFTGDLLPGEVPYSEHCFACFLCGVFTDIFGGKPSGRDRWVCHSCCIKAIANACNEAQNGK